MLLSFFRSLVICLAPGLGPSWPKFAFTSPDPNLCLPTQTETLPVLVPKLHLSNLAPAMAPNLYLPIQGKILQLLPKVLVLPLLLPLLELLLFNGKVKSCFSKFDYIMANMFLIREVATEHFTQSTLPYLLKYYAKNKMNLLGLSFLL